MRRLLLIVLAIVCMASPALAAPVNINAASASELTRVPGINSELARRIVAFRKVNGPFRSVDALTRVPGVTRLTLLSAGNAVFAGRGGGSKLDVNKATFPELYNVSGMTPGTAKAIIDHRDRKGPYRSLSDLRRVPGVEQSVLTAVLPSLSVAPPPTPRATPRRTPRPPVVTRPTTRPSSPPPTRTPTRPSGKRININSADIEALVKLPFVSREAALEIVDNRKAKGKFKDPHEIVKVPLFGEAAFQRLKNLISSE